MAIESMHMKRAPEPLILGNDTSWGRPVMKITLDEDYRR
jgi:hypothetical protein